MSKRGAASGASPVRTPRRELHPRHEGGYHAGPRRRPWRASERLLRRERKCVHSHAKGRYDQSSSGEREKRRQDPRRSRQEDADVSARDANLLEEAGWQDPRGSHTRSRACSSCGGWGLGERRRWIRLGHELGLQLVVVLNTTRIVVRHSNTPSSVVRRSHRTLRTYAF